MNAIESIEPLLQQYIEAAVSGDSAEANRIFTRIISYIDPLIMAKIKVYCANHKGIDMATQKEMHQSAWIYVYNSLSKYDSARGAKFTTYINTGIEKSIAVSASAFNETVHIPPQARRAIRIIDEARDRLAAKGMAPTVDNLLTELPDSEMQTYRKNKAVFENPQAVPKEMYEDLCADLMTEKRRMLENYAESQNIAVHKRSTSDPLSVSRTSMSAREPLTIEDTIRDTHPTPEEAWRTSEDRRMFAYCLNAIPDPEDRALMYAAMKFTQDGMPPSEAIAKAGGLHNLSPGDAKAKLQEIALACRAAVKI